MSEPRVRPVRAADVPAVLALIREVLAEFGLELGVGSDTDADVFRLPGSYADAGGMFWIAEAADGALLGTAGVFPLDASTLELRKMYLHPDARGQGLGRLLLSEALAFARGTGARRVVLDTLATMTGAIRLYERAGFVRDDAQVRGRRCNRGYRLDL